MSYHGIDCKQCGTAGVRNDKYDAYYCPNCMVWIEKKCTDKSCCYCKDRPDFPPKNN